MRPRGALNNCNTHQQQDGYVKSSAMQHIVVAEVTPCMGKLTWQHPRQGRSSSRIYPQLQQQHDVAVLQTRHADNEEEEVWVLTASKHLALRPALTPVHWQHRFVAGFPPAGVSVM